MVINPSSLHFRLGRYEIHHKTENNSKMQKHSPWIYTVDKTILDLETRLLFLNSNAPNVIKVNVTVPLSTTVGKRLRPLSAGESQVWTETYLWASRKIGRKMPAKKRVKKIRHPRKFGRHSRKAPVGTANVWYWFIIIEEIYYTCSIGIKGGNFSGSDAGIYTARYVHSKIRLMKFQSS